jgi:hypothetical protein
MKQLPMYLLMIPLMFTLIAAPAVVSAKNGGDDDWDDDEDESGLEVEADVFTDTTIVKVEINDKKTIFATEADTRDEVVDAVVAKFGLSESEVESALEFEVEDRASRPQDRGKLNREIKREKHENKGKKWWGHNASSTPKVCRDNDTSLQIEADVFTDTTVVKVEFVNAKDEVFTTSATTSADITAAVASRYTSLSTSTIAAALDIDIEDRASRASDKEVDKDCIGTTSTSTPVNNEAKIAELRARVAELQTLLDRLISLLRGN